MNLKCLYVITQVPKPLVALEHIIELSALNSVIDMEIGLLLMSYHWSISVQLSNFNKIEESSNFY